MKINVGDRVKIHPATDLFMRGVRYADVIKIGRRSIYVQSDYGTCHKVSVQNIVEVFANTEGSR